MILGGTPSARRRELTKFVLSSELSTMLALDQGSATACPRRVGDSDKARLVHALIIEDEAYTAEMLRFALSDMGFRSFDVAASEQEAREAAGARRPDLICADVTLNPGDGIRVVKSIAAGGDMPVFFVTAAPQRVQASIADAIVVPKPFSLKQIYLAAERALEPAQKSSE